MKFKDRLILILKHLSEEDYSDFTPLTDPVVRVRARVDLLQRTVQIFTSDDWVPVYYWVRHEPPKSDAVIDRIKRIIRAHHGHKYPGPFNGKRIILDWEGVVYGDL